MRTCHAGHPVSVRWIPATPGFRNPVLDSEARVHLEIGQVVGHWRLRSAWGAKSGSRTGRLKPKTVSILVSILGMRESILEGLAAPVEELSDQPGW